MQNVTFDYSTYNNYPSSMKLSNDEGLTLQKWWVTKDITELTVIPGATIKIIAMAKLNNVTESDSEIIVNSVEAGLEKVRILTATVGRGTKEWFPVNKTVIIPSDVNKVVVKLIGGSGAINVLGETWFNGLKIFQDGALIYSNDLSNWSLHIGAGIGALAGIPAYMLTKKSTRKKRAIIAVGASIVGAVIGGTAGYLTAKP